MARAFARRNQSFDMNIGYLSGVLGKRELLHQRDAQNWRCHDWMGSTKAKFLFHNLTNILHAATNILHA